MTDLSELSNIISLKSVDGGGELVINDFKHLIEVAKNEVKEFLNLKNRNSDENIKNIFSDQARKWSKYTEFVTNCIIGGDLPNFQKKFFVQKVFLSANMAFYGSSEMTRVGQGYPESIARWNGRVIFEDKLNNLFARYDELAFAVSAILSDPNYSTVTSEGVETKVMQLLHDTNNIASNLENLTSKAKETGGSLFVMDSSTIPKIQASVAKLSQDIEEIRKQAVAVTEAASVEFHERWGEYQGIVNAGIASEALKAPSKLWSDDGEKHEGRAKTALGVAFLFGCLSILLLPEVVRRAIDTANDLIPEQNFAVAKLVFSGAVTLVFLTFALWGTRIAVRNYMTEQHLKNDCRNRAAVTEAFINLQKHMGGNFDATVLLATLMRPAQDGIVHDDGLPPTMPASIISHLLEIKKPAA